MTSRPLASILYIDDDPDIRQLVELSLAVAEGITVHTGDCGERALELAQTVRPDLILLDVVMPGMDGLETLRRLRATPQLEHIPVVFMTAREPSREWPRWRALGAAGVIAKRFDPIHLAAEVVALWEQL